MIAVIETGGKQYVVRAGETIFVEKLEKNVGDMVSFKVLMVGEEDGSASKVGMPEVAGAMVGAEVLEHTRAKKVNVVKYKRKVRYTKVHGHRQHQTKVKISSIK
jgi:large subunit ribosomal protein L21